MTRVVFSASAARTIFAEVQRWVEHGIESSGTPLESLVYPLSALVPRRWRCPLELASLSDIVRVVVDGVAIPPDEVKSFSPTNCHFAARDLPRVTAAFNRAIDEQLVQRPRLGVHSKLHCHPFVGGAFLSAADLRFGVHAPQALAWRQRRGLATAILHLVYPDAEPVVAPGPWAVSSDGARCRSVDDRREVRWRIRSWGSDERGAMVDLGQARIVRDSDQGVRAARRRPYWQTRHGASWCDAQKEQLRTAGYPVSRNLLGRGWRRYLVGAGSAPLVFALPPDFPRAPLRVLRVGRAWCNEFEPLDDLPAWILEPRRLPQLSLLRLARHLVGPAVAAAR